MILYAESSAVLRWVLSQPGGEQVADLMRGTEVVFASQLTMAEARRTVRQSGAPEAVTAARYGLLATVESGCTMISIEAALPRAVGAFPVEPVRTLDAIHLATALLVRERHPDLAILSTDARIRTNAVALGFTVVP